MPLALWKAKLIIIDILARIKMCTGVFLRQHRMQGLEDRLRGGFDGSFPLMLQTVVG